MSGPLEGMLGTSEGNLSSTSFIASSDLCSCAKCTQFYTAAAFYTLASKVIHFDSPGDSSRYLLLSSQNDRYSTVMLTPKEDNSSVLVTVLW